MKLKRKKKPSMVQKISNMKFRSAPADVIGVPEDIGAKKSRSASGKKAKRKGSRFELQVRDTMSEWWSAKFYRTPGSGGSVLATDFNMAGDLCTPDESFPFHVECKNQEAFGKFYTFLSSEKAAVWKWWEQAETTAKKDQVPLLIFTKNRMPVFVMMNNNFFESINKAAPKKLKKSLQNTLSDSFYLKVEDKIVMFLDTLVKYPKDLILGVCSES